MCLGIAAADEGRCGTVFPGAGALAAGRSSRESQRLQWRADIGEETRG